MLKPKKLIEVSLPIKEISAESVRDKSIRHGHISTLHLWWARRPLPVCRAVVFASLVPDPLDENCPQAFRDAIEIILGSSTNLLDPYKPYKDIPWTAIYDPMEDNHRNRLQMFIGKFTNEMQEHMIKHTKKPPAKKMLSDSSLIKWDNKNNEEIINKARKLIFVSHQLSAFNSTKSAIELLSEFETLYGNIKKAEDDLYRLKDRHVATEVSKQKETALHHAIEAFLDRMPKVFDPFAGGGAIPLEAARLGCRSYGNDINPVAHIIQKGSLEFPQKYGKPIIYSKEEFIKLYGEASWKEYLEEAENPKSELERVYDDGNVIGLKIPNRLSFDVEYYAKKLLEETEKEIGHLYPADEKGNRPIAYYWARVGNCSNPSCQAEVPLLRGFYLAKTKSKRIYLSPIINGTDINFEIIKGAYDEKELKGWIKGGNLTCPCCGSYTEVKKLRKQFIDKKSKERLLAIVYKGDRTKEYRIPSLTEIEQITSEIDILERPNEKLPVEYTGKFPRPWGFKTWGDIHSDRQLFSIQTMVRIINRNYGNLNSVYKKAIIIYLSFLIDRISVLITNLGRWDNTTEHGQSPFSRQAMAMTFDYPEYNLSSIGYTQLKWIIRVIQEESLNSFSTTLKNSSSGEKNQFEENYLTAVVTDPPYYDAIPYADLSDFFYVWQKRTLGKVYPLNFATPQTPKTEECTALKHYHGGNSTVAKNHFEKKLLQIFDAIEHQTSEIVSIMFAHQSTEAWTTLCNSILGSRMNITGSWAMDTELANRPLALKKSALSSSVTVACKPIKSIGYGDFKEVKKAIEKRVGEEVELLYELGFRGADLLTACFGQAVSEFGKYKMVEKANGEQVSVAELLEIAKESAFNALLKGFDGDDYTKFYIGWLQLYGFTESDFDDAAKFSRVGLSINVQELFTEDILVKNGNKQTLGTYKDRIRETSNRGLKSQNSQIDEIHRAMYLYQGKDRRALLQYINSFAVETTSSFWRVLTSLVEVLPGGSDDHKQAFGLLTNKENLISESKALDAATPKQGTLNL